MSTVDCGVTHKTDPDYDVEYDEEDLDDDEEDDEDDDDDDAMQPVNPMTPRPLAQWGVELPTMARQQGKN